MSISLIYPSYGKNQLTDRKIREVIYRTHTLLPSEILDKRLTLPEKPIFSNISVVSGEDAASLWNSDLADELVGLRPEELPLCAKVFVSIRVFYLLDTMTRTRVMLVKALHPANPLWARFENSKLWITPKAF